MKDPKYGDSMKASLRHLIRDALPLAGAALFALPAGAQVSPAQSQDVTAPCDFSEVPGVVWWGSEREMSLSRLAAYLAPIYWFSPDEPLMNRAEGPDIRLPEPFPGEPVPDRPVVYYQVEQVLARGDAEGPAFVRDPSGQPNSLIDLQNVAAFTLTYLAYFRSEEGFGAHDHDVEPTEFKTVVLRHTSDSFLEWLDGPAQCDEPTYVIGVTRSSAKAHGLRWYWNVLESDIYTTFPMHLLVEEGKHGLATDKNGDGVFTKGYDANVRINDAWGTRDIIRTGMLFTGGYEGWMAKVRRPEHRVFPPLPADSPLQDQVARLADGEEHAVYELRPFPSSEFAADNPPLRPYIESHEVRDWPDVGELQDVEQWVNWVEEGAVLKSLSVSYYQDGAGGFSFVFPFFVVRHLTEPLTGGYIVQRMYLKDKGLRDFGWMALYTPSASRWLDTYLAAGAEFDVEEDATGALTEDWDFVLETGLKFRVSIERTPLKFLTFFTDFWGLRVGIKNRGFFDINQLTYVFEFGAGSF